MKLAFLNRLYSRTMALAQRKSAQVWLGVIAFIESSFFPIPADVMFVPMVIATPERAYRLAIIATASSVLGSAFGYAIGMYAFQELAQPMLETLGKMETFEHYRNILHSDIWMLWGLLLSSGFTHLPPIKVVTILSGFSGVGFGVFMVSATISRGARFFLLAWLLKRYGEPIRDWIERRLTLLAIAFFVLVAALYLLVKFV